MKYFLPLILLLALVPSVRAADIPPALVSQVYGSVVLLYAQDDSGNLKMRCTATAYRTLADVDNAKKIKPKVIRQGYRFVTAAHCVSGETDSEQKLGKYFVTLDTAGPKTFIPAVLVEAGDKKKGDDFSIFDVVESDSKIPIVPLGTSDSVSLGENVINVAGPEGLGKQFFIGYVSEKHLDRPPLDAGDVQWTDVMLVSIGGGPGSSGSAIVSVAQKAIVGFLVGSKGGQGGFIVVPVKKFIDFEKAVDAGTYKKEKPNRDSEEVIEGT